MPKEHTCAEKQAKTNFVQKDNAEVGMIDDKNKNLKQLTKQLSHHTLNNIDMIVYFLAAFHCKYLYIQGILKKASRYLHCPSNEQYLLRETLNSDHVTMLMTLAIFQVKMTYHCY